MALIGQRYRIDTTRCSGWPPVSANLAYGALYLSGLALLSTAWLGLLRCAATVGGPSVARVLLYALGMHLAILGGPPFLSDDALYYAALGRALSLHPGWGTPLSPLCTTLASDDRFLSILDAHWRCAASPYLPGFHLIAWAVGKLGRDDMAAHLRLYQAIAGAAMLAAGYLTAAALSGTKQRPAVGAALVALNPLALVEGTQNAHNDALLALCCALLALALRRRKSLLALGSIGLSLTIKASALLLAGFYGTHLLLAWLRDRSKPLWRALPWLLAVAVAVGLVFLAVAPSAIPGVCGLIGDPRSPWDYCTRSIECLPRAVLRWGLHRPTAAWLVGLVFRWLGGVWLLYAAWRSQTRVLPWLATGLLVYFLYLHGWSQSWYFLSLLPLLPWAKGRVRAALSCVSVSGCAYYALVLLGNCLRDDMAVALMDLAQGLIVLAPPSVVLLRGRKPNPLLVPGVL